MSERYAESGAMVTGVAMVLAKQMFDPGTDIHLVDAWRPQRDDVKRALRIKAIEILKHLDNIRAVN